MSGDRCLNGKRGCGLTEPHRHAPPPGHGGHNENHEAMLACAAPEDPPSLERPFGRDTGDELCRLRTLLRQVLDEDDDQPIQSWLIEEIKAALAVKP